MTVKERLIKFIKHKGISTRAFCREIGVSETFVSSMRTSLQPDKINSISVHYPELNTAWLLTGEGEMIKPPKNPFSQLTEEVIEERVVDNVKAYIDNMFESGRAYHASAVERMLKEKDKEIERLREELRKEQEENVRLKAQKGLE